jgi:hypothetical protein
MWGHMLRFIVQPPRIPTLHELIDDMIRDRVPLGLSKFDFRTTHDLTSAS